MVIERKNQNVTGKTKGPRRKREDRRGRLGAEWLGGGEAGKQRVEAPAGEGLNLCRALLGRHLEKEIHPEEKEDDVRRPAREQRGQLSDVAHGLDKPRNDPIADGDTDAERDA